jgi:hypothetical protein
MWSFFPGDTGTWAPILAAGSPTYRSAAAVYDSLGDRILLTDGGSVWSIPPGPALAWNLIASSNRIRIQASAILDPRRNRLIIYGGDEYQPHFGGGTVSEVWSLSLDGTSTWTLMGYGPAQYGSSGHAAFYDSIRDPERVA